MRNRKLQMLCEGAILVALAQILSMLKLWEMPWGGSITLGMLPIFLFAVRWGTRWGLVAGFAYGLLQVMFDGGFAISWQSILGDYLVAFTVLGLGGMFRGKIKNDAVAFTLGAFVAMMLRFFCAFLSGWILWADVVNDAPYMQEVIAAYIPALSNLTGTTLAVVYSLVYNGVYMIPEIILTCVVGFLLVQFAGKQVLDKPKQA